MAAAAARKRYASNSISSATPYYTHGGPTLLSEVGTDLREKKPSAKEVQEWAGVYDHFEARTQSLYTWRLPQWNTWGQIAQYMRPDRFYAFIVGNQYNQGLRKDYQIRDRTATLCGEVCAAGLMAGLTDPDREWLKYGPAIPDFELDKQGKAYYNDIAERHNYILTHSNFYDAQAQHYDDLVFFGCAPIIDYPDRDTIIQCFTPCAGEYMLGAGFDFSDEVLYREFRQTVSQTVEQFGPENCPPDVLQMWNQKGGALDYENVIGHAIEPNYPLPGMTDGSSVGVVPGGFTWREGYWIRGKKDSRPLSLTGINEQPFAVSRWNTQGNNPYGRGVGEYMLGDTIQLQFETLQKAMSLEKVNNPPMGADVALMNLPSSTNPGKITYMNTGAGGEKKFFPLYEIRPDIPAISADIALIQQRIGQTAYNDIFRMMEDLREKTRGQVTATEIDALKEERLMRLGPVIGRVYGSLRVRMRRHLAIMARAGLMPRKPPSLQRVPIKIEFVSMLTAAQKATRTAAIARSMQFAGSLSGAWPEAKFAMDADKAIREFNDGVGATPQIVRSPREVQQMVAKEQQNQKMQALMSQSLPGAKAAEALSRTSLAPGSALSALVQPPQ